MSSGSDRLWSRRARALCVSLVLGVCGIGVGAVRAEQPSEEVLERVRACLAQSYEDEYERQDWLKYLSGGRQKRLSDGSREYVVFGDSVEYDQVQVCVWLPQADAAVGELLAQGHFRGLLASSSLGHGLRMSRVAMRGIEYTKLANELCKVPVPHLRMEMGLTVPVRELDCGERGALYVACVSHDELRASLMVEPFSLSDPVIRQVSRLFLKRLLLEELTGRRVWPKTLAEMVRDFWRGDAERLLLLTSGMGVGAWELEAFRYAACRSWQERWPELEPVVGLSREELAAEMCRAEGKLRTVWPKVDGSVRALLTKKWPELAEWRL